MAMRREEYLVTTGARSGRRTEVLPDSGRVTQVDAAEAMGIGQPYLSELEGGKFGSSLTHVLRLLRFVGCEVVVRQGNPVAERLIAWLSDTPVAVLVPRPDFRIQMNWRSEGIERWGLGSPALSVGLPIGTQTGPRDMRGLDFFENMLPEGPVLTRMATMAGDARSTPMASSKRSAGTAQARSWCCATATGRAETTTADTRR